MELKQTTKKTHKWSFPKAVFCNIVLQYFVRVFERHTVEIIPGRGHGVVQLGTDLNRKRGGAGF